MKFHRVSTYSNYRFYCALCDSNKYILLEDHEIDYTKQKSLTNNIEEVLAHIVSGLFGKHNEYEFYQLGEDGIFKLDFNTKGRITRDGPYGKAITNVEWTFITKNIRNFITLYGDSSEIS